MKTTAVEARLEQVKAGAPFDRALLDELRRSPVAEGLYPVLTSQLQLRDKVGAVITAAALLLAEPRVGACAPALVALEQHTAHAIRLPHADRTRLHRLAAMLARVIPQTTAFALRMT